MTHARHLGRWALLGLTIVTTSPAMAGGLENLERERARLVAVLTDATLNPDARQARIDGIARRLRDLERIVLQDGSLPARATPTVRQAFESYDLTFLLHAAAEAEVSLPEHWFAMIGISTDSLMAAKGGRG
jgi:hypothetical protein